MRERKVRGRRARCVLSKPTFFAQNCAMQRRGLPYRLPRRGRFRSEDDGERDASREKAGRERGANRNGGAACGLQRSGEQQAAAPPPPPVTVATPLNQRLTEWDEFTGRFEATAAVDVRARVSGYLQSDQLRRRRDGQGGRRALRHRSAPLSGGGRPREGRSRRRQCASSSWRDQPARTGAGARRRRRRCRWRRSTSACRSRRTAEARVQQATAALNAEQLNLDFTKVRAPISGRVSNRRIDVGNLVTGDPNATLLTTIVTLDPIYFDLRHERGGLPRLSARGRARRAALDARQRDDRRGAPAGRTDWPHKGTMNFVDNRLDAGLGHDPRARDLPNPDLFITPGQFGRLRMPGSNEYEAILIPDSAIVTDQSNRIVMTVAEDGTSSCRSRSGPGPSAARGLADRARGPRPATRRSSSTASCAPGRARKVTPQHGTIEPRQPTRRQN